MNTETLHDHNSSIIWKPSAIAGFFLLCLAVVAGKNTIGSPTILIFLLPGIVLVLSVFLHGSRHMNYLKLSEKGFSYRWGLYTWHFDWDDCEQFETHQMSFYRGVREYVVFSTRNTKPKKFGTALNRLVFGQDYTLPGMDYGIPPRELAAKMNGYRVPKGSTQRGFDSRSPLSPEARQHFHNPNKKKKTPFLTFFAYLSLALSPFAILISVIFLFPNDEDYCAHDQNHQRGISYCTGLLENGELDDRTRASFISNRGIHHNQIKNWDEAIDDFTKAIDLSPDFPNAYVARAITYYKMKRYAEALSDYDRVIALNNPDHKNVYDGRGITYMAMEKYDEALADFEKAVSIDPRDHSAFFNSGLVYKRLGQYDKAIVQFDAAIKAEPGFSRAKRLRKKTIRLKKKYGISSVIERKENPVDGDKRQYVAALSPAQRYEKRTEG